MSDQPVRRRAASYGAWALMLVPAWLLVWSAHAIWATYSPTPFNDQWVNLAALRDVPAGGWAHYLFSQHNEHRILIPRLVFLADLHWFQGRNALNLVAIGLIQVAGAACFVRAALSERVGVLSALALSAGVAMIFSLMQWENLFWGFQVSFVAVYAAAAWALYIYFLAGDAGRVRWGLLAGAMIMLFVATFSMANGVFAGIAMTLTGVVIRQRRAVIATAAVTTLILLAVYLYGYHRIEAHSPPGLVLQHPGRFLFYIALFFGNLWWAANPTIAAFIGMVGCLATVGMFLVLVRKGAGDPVRATLFAIVLFVGMSAAVTGIGRLSFGATQALASRYMTPTAYFWAAHALFWAVTLQRSGAGWLSLQRGASSWTLTLRRGPHSWVRLGFVAVLGLAIWRLVVLQAFGEEQVMGTRERILTGSSALLSGLDDEQAVRDVYPDPLLVAQLTPMMREKRLTIFADPPVATLGKPFDRPIAKDPGACRGFFDVLEPAKDGMGVWRAIGWGWDVEARRPFSRIVLVDGDGHVVGIGLSGLPRPDVAKAVRGVRGADVGWLTRARPGAGAQVRAFGITSAGTACELGRKEWGA